MNANQQLDFLEHPTREEYRLPYAGSRLTAANGDISFWSVPLTGGYPGGVCTGDALAVLALRFLRQCPDENTDETHLTSIALGWLEAARAANADEFETLKGQVVGFVGRLTPWTVTAAQNVGQNLDKKDPVKLLESANAGLVWVKPVPPWKQDSHDVTAKRNCEISTSDCKHSGE
jgi:hypothetical protein